MQKTNKPEIHGGAVSTPVDVAFQQGFLKGTYCALCDFLVFLLYFMMSDVYIKVETDNSSNIQFSSSSVPRKIN